MAMVIDVAPGDGKKLVPDIAADDSKNFPQKFLWQRWRATTHVSGTTGSADRTEQKQFQLEMKVCIHFPTS